MSKICCMIHNFIQMQQQLQTEPSRGQCVTNLHDQKGTNEAKSESVNKCFITLSEKTKPRIPAISWSMKITVRQIQNCQRRERDDYLQHCKNEFILQRTESRMFCDCMKTQLLLIADNNHQIKGSQQRYIVKKQKVKPKT